MQAIEVHTLGEQGGLQRLGIVADAPCGEFLLIECAYRMADASEFLQCEFVANEGEPVEGFKSATFSLDPETARKLTP